MGISKPCGARIVNVKETLYKLIQQRNFNMKLKKGIATIICGFAGIGKSELERRQQELGLKILDAESRPFHWISYADKIKNPTFPKNYVKFIKENLYKYDIICASPAGTVRRALDRAHLEYYIVYPADVDKEVYLARYRNRGSDDEFINSVDKYWDELIKDLKRNPSDKVIALRGDSYLYDIIKNAKEL